MAAPETTNLAVLVDADNAQSSVIAEILGEVARYGTATVKRAYGNWTTPHLASWKNVLHVHAVQPIQQFSYTRGKNATDSALIIDAMDLLHGGKVDGFCLVSSDSDFTRLATRIREAGLAVYGFGDKKTPQPFVAACDKFVFTEILGEPAKKSKPQKATNSKLRELLLLAISSSAQEDGWASLGAVGSLVNKNDPSFDSRNFGYRKLGDLVRDQSYLEVDERQCGGESSVVHLYVRIKEV
ncbi:MAG TPA: NYN domain-containing protein [Gammaproteobacteria bacterium]|nr:NYN domain-containing protein [Gammaproteobacteria bacterium]